MPEITPSFVMQYERRMRAITETEYVRRLGAKNTWWNKVARTLPIEGKTERMTWFLDTASIEPIGPTGTGALDFEGLVTQTAEYPTFKHGKGITVQRDQIEDLDGTGLNQLSKWSENIGNETAYYPQRLMAQLVLNGAATNGSANAYDGVPFFTDESNLHPLNPFNPAIGGYANWLHGAANATTGYPGALKIDSSVTTDVAVDNLGLAIAYIASLKMPNGIDPRFLTPLYIMGPPRLAPRMRQITDAKFIAQAAAAGGGSADVIALIEGWGLGTPVVVQEFAKSTNYSFKQPFVQAATGNVSYADVTASGSDTTWYIVCQEMQTTQLGGLLYVTRKPFKVNYYTGDAGGTGLDAVLDRADEFEYHVKGRMSAQYGHPYTIFRIDAT
jgi:hypothetical protein